MISLVDIIPYCNDHGIFLEPFSSKILVKFGSKIRIVGRVVCFFVFSLLFCFVLDLP